MPSNIRLPWPCRGLGALNWRDAVTEPAKHSSSAIAADAIGGHGWRVLCMGQISLPASFSFVCYRTRFEVGVEPDGEQGAKLTVQAHLGALPYSAESMMARQYIKAMVQVGRDLPYAELSLSRKQAITVQGTMKFPDRPAMGVVVASAAVIAIAVKPFIDIISFFRDAGKSTA